jgi:iron(II)-dependent oxidoreductase
MTKTIRATRDAYVGLENPTQAEWSGWHGAMLEARASIREEARIDLGLYDDPDTGWSDTSFRQLFLFMYDASFYDRDARRYRTAEQIDGWLQMFGRIDSVLLWHAYPRLGFDSRNQFDFYRTMPGGVAQLREEVIDPLHARKIRVFVDYNPWDRALSDAGATAHIGDLSDIVADLDADGVMLDTMTDAPEALAQAVSARRRGVVFAPELVPADRDLGRFRQSWAQWLDIGDSTMPTIYRQQWLVPRHRLLAIRRWDTSRRRDIIYSFFNGSGLILWDNIFGTWNPYSREDRRLIAETAAIFDAYEDVFVHGEWLPLVPTGVAGLDANRWNGAGNGDPRVLITLRNRATQRLSYRVPFEAPSGMTWVAFWGDKHEVVGGDSVIIEPEGVQALVLDEASAAQAAFTHFEGLSKRANVALPGYDERSPPRLLHPLPEASTNVRKVTAGAASKTASAGRMIEIPAGTFEMKIRHERRECGCYPWGATDDAFWGWFSKDIVVHDRRVQVAPFAIRAMAVTNAEFVEFVRSSGYRPEDSQRFLEHLARTEDGSFPLELPPSQAGLPVTFVSLADARAYAGWRGQRLPTEIEWQWAAEGAGSGHRYPWGNEERQLSSGMRPALDAANRTPHGVMGMSGNTWELTESEHSDGHTRFVMLRGGVFLPPGESEWLPTRGPRPNDSHVKYVLLADGLDRSEAVSFRTVVDC